MGRYSPIERIGINSTEAAVLNFGWIFREQPLIDMGIDAHIESVVNGNPTGRLLGVQIKSGPSHFTEKDEHLVYYGTLVHLDYWLKHTLPVILVGHFPETGKTYWVHVNKDTVKTTTKHWKIEIPKSQELNRESITKLLAVLEGTAEEIKDRNLKLHLENMKFVKDGGKLVIYQEEWHNKSLGRGALNLIKVYPDGVEEIIKPSQYWYTGYSVKGLAEAVFPWASVSIDTDFYQKNFDNSVYGVYSRGSTVPGKIYPYEVVCGGEVGLYRLQLNLSKLGESFLEVMSYIDS